VITCLRLQGIYVCSQGAPRSSQELQRTPRNTKGAPSKRHAGAPRIHPGKNPGYPRTHKDPGDTQEGPEAAPGLPLAVPGCYWLLLAAPGCSWLLLPAPGHLLAAPAGCSWLLLPAAASYCSCLLLAALGCSWLLLATSWMSPGCFWLLLADPGCSCPLLAAPGCSWLLLAAPRCFLDAPGSGLLQAIPTTPCCSRLILTAPACSWLSLAAPGCSWLLEAAPGCFWLLLAAPVCPPSSRQDTPRVFSSCVHSIRRRLGAGPGVIEKTESADAKGKATATVLVR
jgi:hypothetical protein